jgi:nucleotide-binding universal stress UspA family protein
MRRIIAGVDGSAPSVRALRVAARLVEDLADAELIVVHARYVQYLWLPDHVAEDEFADVLDAAEQFVRRTVERDLADRPLRWRLECREGEPSDALCEIAHETGGEALVVVGRQGWSAVRELLLGSVSNRLVHRGDCPVLLVH